MANDPSMEKEKDDDRMQRRPLQHAAGGLASFAFITVTQILSGGTLDLPLRVALVLFAVAIPFQVILFYGRIPNVPEKGNMKWTHILYWSIWYGSTGLVMLGFGAMFSHFACWLGPLFVVAAWVAYVTFRWWANSGDFPD